MKLGKIVLLVVGLSLALLVISYTECSSPEQTVVEQKVTENKAIEQKVVKQQAVEKEVDEKKVVEYKFGELTRLADKYGTDKGTTGHSFTEVYEYFFYPLKNKATKIFEIGVGKGASMKMLGEYFPDAIVYGIDIKDTSYLNSDRLKTFIADQSNRIQLKNVMDVTGGDFDIIIDDGGHSMNLQQISLGFLFKYVKRGGYYIVEDVHTSVYELYKGRYGAKKSGENTTLFMIYRFVMNGRIRSQYMTDEEEEYLTANIKYCSLVSRRRGTSITCIFKKNERRSKATRAYLEPPVVAP